MSPSPGRGCVYSQLDCDSQGAAQVSPAPQGYSSAPKPVQLLSKYISVQFSSVAQSCPTLCNPMNRSTPQYLICGLPRWLSGKKKNLPANAGDTGLIPGSGRSPGEGNVNSLQYSCLENLMDRGAWRSTIYGVKKSWTRLSD